jgi:hypothetical protein
MSRGPGSQTSVKKMKTHEKQIQALQLRRAGAGYEEIARQVGYRNSSGAYKAVRAALLKTLQEPSEDVRKLELERLDRLMLGIWPAAIGGNLEALDRVLKIMKHRAEITGLIVNKTALTTPDGEQSYEPVDDESARIIFSAVFARLGFEISAPIPNNGQTADNGQTPLEESGGGNGVNRIGP